MKVFRPVEKAKLVWRLFVLLLVVERFFIMMRIALLVVSAQNDSAE